MTTITLTPELVLAAQEIMSAAVPVETVDPKYTVTSEFTEVPKSQVAPALAKWKKAKAKLDKVKQELEAAEREIKDLMNYAEVLVIAETGQHVVESRVTTGQVFDTTRFRKEQPEVAAKYQRTRYSRGFRVLV